MSQELVAIGVITLFAVITNVLNTFVTIRFVYTPDFIEKRRQVQKVREEYKKALMSKDEKQIKKLEQRINAIKKIESELTMKTFRIMPLSLGIFYIFWWLMSGWYSDLGNFVYLPYILPFVGTNMNFLSWYIFASIVFGALFRRLFYPKM